MAAVLAVPSAAMAMDWSDWKLVDQGDDVGHIAVDGSTRNYRHVGFQAEGFTNRIEGSWKVSCEGGFATARHFTLQIKYTLTLKVPARVRGGVTRSFVSVMCMRTMVSPQRSTRSDSTVVRRRCADEWLLTSISRRRTRLLGVPEAESWTRG